MKTIGLILSGCGVNDGSEIHETVATLIALSQRGCKVLAFAPEKFQTQVVDHYRQEVVDEQRNILTEAARLMRGEIAPLQALVIEELDGIVVPGGFGAALNLCDFAQKGTAMVLEPSWLSVARACVVAQKPLALMCIAPVMAPAIFGSGVQVTVGVQGEAANAIEEMGGVHVPCEVDGYCVDEERGCFSTPAYMLAKNAYEAYVGIDKMIGAMLDSCHSRESGDFL